MTHPTGVSPDWQALLNASDADEAMQELHDRLDREAEHGSASICPASSGAGQRPVPSRATHPQPPTALASRSAATETPSHHEDAAAACQRPAA